MTYRGRVKNGVIVLDPPAPLPEGTEVDVEVKGLSSLAESLLKFAGIADDLPADYAENHDHYLYGVPKVKP